MRLLDASDDDILVTQAWGDPPAHWVEVARALRTLTDAWYADHGSPPWVSQPGPRCLHGFVQAALAQAGGAVTVGAECPRGVVGGGGVAWSTVAAWLDLATYDPDEALGTLVHSGLLDAMVAGGEGTCVAVLHHAAPGRVVAGVQRFKSLPLARVERLGSAGVRVDVFPAWGAGGTVAATGRVAPGYSCILALR